MSGSLSRLGSVGLGIHYGVVHRDSRLQMMNLRIRCVEPRRLTKTALQKSTALGRLSGAAIGLFTAMIAISITPEAFEATKATLGFRQQAGQSQIGNTAH
jgi:hypothetical protein